MWSVSCITLCTSTAFADEITMYLNGTEIAPLEEAHQPAIVQDGILYLPMRNVFEAMGAVVRWSSLGQIISGGMGGMNYETGIGKYVVTVNGEDMEIEAPVLLLNDRTLILPKVVTDCFGADVEWLESDSQVNITYTPENSTIMTIDLTDLEESENE